MSAWDNAVNREFMAKLIALAEAYSSEDALLDKSMEFGWDVYALLRETNDINFKSAHQPEAPDSLENARCPICDLLKDGHPQCVCGDVK